MLLAAIEGISSVYSILGHSAEIQYNLTCQAKAGRLTFFNIVNLWAESIILAPLKTELIIKETWRGSADGGCFGNRDNLYLNLLVLLVITLNPYHPQLWPCKVLVISSNCLEWTSYMMNECNWINKPLMLEQTLRKCVSNPVWSKINL